MNQSVTYLKAFGIIIMVIGHTMSAVPYFNQFIFMFHMPLFLFVSGYCFKPKYLNDTKTYLAKRVKGIYWPYLKWSLLFLLLHNFLIDINIYNFYYGFGNQVSYVYVADDYITRGLSIIFLMCNHEQLLGGYWFLNILFFGSILAFFSLKLFRKVEYSLLANMAVSILLTLAKLSFRYSFLPLQTFYSSTFILAGIFFAKRQIPVFPRWAAALSLLVTFVGSFFWPMGIGEFPYDIRCIIPYFLTALLAIWGFYSLFTRLTERCILTRCLTFIGNNTLTILTWHFLMFKIISLLIIWIYGLDIELLSQFPVIIQCSQTGWWVYYALVSLLASCGLAYCNRFIKNSWLKL